MSWPLNRRYDVFIAWLIAFAIACAIAVVAFSGSLGCWASGLPRGGPPPPGWIDRRPLILFMPTVLTALIGGWAAFGSTRWVARLAGLVLTGAITIGVFLVTLPTIGSLWVICF